MPSKIEFIFDFGSPNAYFVYSVLPDIAAKHGATLEITPILLGGLFKSTNNQPPWSAFGKIKGKLEYEMLEIRRFIEKHGLSKYKLNPNFPINTVTLMRGLIVAQEEGYADTYIDAGLRAMWEDGENMGDKEVFANVMSAAGLDGAHILARAGDQEIKDRLIANTQDAENRGAFGVPTFFVDGDMYFGKERLHQIEAQLAAS